MLLHPGRWKSLRPRYEQDRPHRMLALDGGGIRGILTLGILQKIEKLVAEKHNQKLCDYFDYIAGTIPGGLMNTIQIDQDINCRTVGRCTYGAHLDNEIMDLVPRQVHEGMTKDEYYAAPLIPLATDMGRRFLYCRYNVDLSSKGLTALGFPKVNPATIQKMDAVENIPALTEIGIAAEQQVHASHFGPFI